MLKYTKTTLQKIEGLLSTQGYVVRYEKGNFNSGFCVVESKKLVIINRFFDIEGRINAALDIIASIELEEDLWDEKELKLYKVALHLSADHG